VLNSSINPITNPNSFYIHVTIFSGVFYYLQIRVWEKQDRNQHKLHLYAYTFINIMFININLYHCNYIYIVFIVDNMSFIVYVLLCAVFRLTVV
jgi:hypothetical protein